MRRIMRQTITVLTPGTTTDRGVTVEDWTKPTRRTVSGCSIQPGAGDVDWIRATGVVSDFIVYAPAGIQVTAKNRIELPGVAGQFLLEGPPERWEIGLRTDHVRLRLRKRDG